MSKSFFWSFIFFPFGAVHAQPGSYPITTNKNISTVELTQNFKNPPPESRLRCYWWWLNSMATKESITRDLEQMREKGYGGAAIVDAGSSNYQVAKKTAAGPVFMSPQWMELYKHAVKEAERLGIELSVNVQSGWNPGGPSITPEYALKKLVWSVVTIKGNNLIDTILPAPEKKFLYKDILVQAIKLNDKDYPVKDSAIKFWSIKSYNEKIGWKGIYPLHRLREEFPESKNSRAFKKKEIIDISRYYDGKTLHWTAPEGDWLIIRYGYTCTGAVTSTTSDGWNGLSLDHLNPKAFDLFSNTVITPLIKTAQTAGNSVKWLQTDSWEMDLVNWTDDFQDQFKANNRYDMTDFMPVLAGYVVESENISTRFLHDYRITIANSIRDNHYKLFYNLAHHYGMGIHPESGGPHSAPVDALDIMSVSDFPQGEFWAMSNTHRIKDDERLSVKQSACVAHTNGIRFVAAEGPTSIGPQWERSPKDLKSNIDRVFCSGVNRIEWHTFTSSPKEFGLPGNEYFAGTHLNPNVTWWNMARDFIQYLNRCSYLLQQGLFVADVLYYYGDDTPNFVFLKEEFKELNPGYSWDKCSKEVLLKRVDYERNQLLLPDGMRYKLLVLPSEKAIDISVLKKIEDLVNKGAIVYGPRPVQSSGLIGFPDSDNAIKRLADRLWGNIDGKKITENRIGKGKIVWGKDINNVLEEMKIRPDFQYKSCKNTASLDFIHRTTAKADIYFVSNRFSRKAYNDFEYRYLPNLPDRYEQAECWFRITGKKPELWNPETGESVELLMYCEENGYTKIPLHFEPDGSKFIIFRDTTPSAHVVKVQKNGHSYFPDNHFETNLFQDIEICKKGRILSAYSEDTVQCTITLQNGQNYSLKPTKMTDDVPITGSWDLQFDTLWGGPPRIKIDSLKSWTEFNEPGIRYYSGTALYKISFPGDNLDLSADRIFLDLGNVQEMGRIKINGNQLPVKWHAPFRYDITGLVKKGENYLEVEVVNLWVNRLIGDSKTMDGKRFTRTNITKFESPEAEKQLRISGLLGPVIIKSIKGITIPENSGN